VFNFAVAEHHTYFAGDGGVWVHNVCPALLDEYDVFFRTKLDELAPGGNSTPAQWDAAVDDVMQKLLADKARIPEAEVGAVVAHMLTDPPPGVPSIGTLTRVADNVYESRLTNLRYGAHDNPDVGNYVRHVMEHASDAPKGKARHGVFDEGRRGVLKVIDEAWLSKNADYSKVVAHTSYDVGGVPYENYTIDLGRRIGWLGGNMGNSTGNPACNKLFLIVKNGNEVVTAYPKP